MSTPRIIGITLVRDEDLFVERAVRNVLEFCDELIFVDHRSRDRTPQLLARLAEESPKPATVHSIAKPPASHDLISGYAGQAVWLFGVDGDEIYDPERLRAFKCRLLKGEFDDVWQIKGNCLHCTQLDLAYERASGYLAPPAPSVTKLFNFRIIESWEGDTPERLHGPSMKFKPPYSKNDYMLNRDYAWDDSPFRCVHACFLRRSSLEKRPRARRNIPDRNAPRRAPLRAWSWVRESLGFPEESAWKAHYRKGEPATVSVEGFFPTAVARAAARR
jgi:hypothetical protein